MKKITFKFLFIFGLFSYAQETDYETDYIKELKDGNERFLNEKSINKHHSKKDVLELSNGQHPDYIIVTCSDSRVDPTIIFDQGLGDMFVIRTAGNLVDDIGLGSIEYAAEHLHSKQIIVLGHTNCGAIKAFLDHEHDYNKIHDNTKHLIKYIAKEKEEKQLKEKTIDKAVLANTKHVYNHILEESDIIKELVENEEIKINYAIYDTSTGKVNW